MAGGAETPNIAALPAIVLIGAGSGRRSAREAIDLSNDRGVTLGRLFTSLLEEPMVVALPSAHALAQNDGDAALSLKDLAGETFIVYARQHGPGLYDATASACLKVGFSPRLGQEAPRITSALSLVAAGLGIYAV